MTGAERIAAERARQVEVKGWTAEHDDEHDDGELALAAASYAAWSNGVEALEVGASGVPRSIWPWRRKDDKRPAFADLSDAARLRLLEKAAALIAAEIDRLLRAKERE